MKTTIGYPFLIDARVLEDRMFAIWMTALVQRWRQHDTLRELSKLDDRQLADIGLTRGQLASVSIGRDASNGQSVRA